MSEQLEQYLPKNDVRIKVYNKFLNMFQTVINNDTKSENGESSNIDYIRFNISNTKLKILSLNLEKAIFNDTLTKVGDQWNEQFKNKYINSSIRIYVNLDPNSYIGNKKLIQRLLNNEFSVEYFCSKMTSEEMFPEAYEWYYEEQRKEKEIEEKFKEAMNNTTGAFKCGKCKSWKTSYYQLQLRSSDEPMTTFVTCMNCHNRWKFN